MNKDKRRADLPMAHYIVSSSVVFAVHLVDTKFLCKSFVVEMVTMKMKFTRITFTTHFSRESNSFYSRNDSKVPFVVDYKSDSLDESACVASAYNAYTVYISALSFKVFIKAKEWVEITRCSINSNYKTTHCQRVRWGPFDCNGKNWTMEGSSSANLSIAWINCIQFKKMRMDSGNRSLRRRLRCCCCCCRRRHCAKDSIWYVLCTSLWPVQGQCRQWEWHQKNTHTRRKYVRTHCYGLWWAQRCILRLNTKKRKQFQ